VIELRYFEPVGAPPREELRRRFIGELRVNPGRWAIFGAYAKPDTARTTAWRIRNPRSSSDRASWGAAGDFEAEVHTIAGQTTVFVRYVGRVVA